MNPLLTLLITIAVAGLFLYWINRPEAPIGPGWVKWLINGIVCIAVVLYALGVLFGYHFPGLR